MVGWLVVVVAVVVAAGGCGGGVCVLEMLAQCAI